MFDKRAFVTRVESANTNEIAQLLIRSIVQEEKALRAYFGDERYQRLHLMALKLSDSRTTRKPKGNVVVIHGIMGSELTKLKSLDVYEVTMKGDGSVPHTLGLLQTLAGKEIKTYYIEENHGRLQANGNVFRALDELLEKGSSAELDENPSSRTIQENEATKKEVSKQLAAARFADELLLKDFVNRMGTRSAESISIPYMTYQERRVEESLTRGLLGYHDDEERHTARRNVYQKFEYFLGTSRGFTRQLRTTFAPPPEPPPPPRRILRVLVVADPAEDAHLPRCER